MVVELSFHARAFLFYARAFLFYARMFLFYDGGTIIGIYLLDL